MSQVKNYSILVYKILQCFLTHCNIYHDAACSAYFIIMITFQIVIKTTEEPYFIKPHFYTSIIYHEEDFKKMLLQATKLSRLRCVLKQLATTRNSVSNFHNSRMNKI